MRPEEMTTVEAATASIHLEIDRLSQRTRDMTSTSAEAVQREAISVIHSCAMMKHRFVSIDGLARAVELEGRAQRIVDHCKNKNSGAKR